jgi:antitoxin MazE
MRIEFLRWGNSLALRVPSAFAKEVGATEGQQAEMTVERGALVVKVVKSKRRPYALEHLIDGITPENRHPATDWGSPVGNEV